MMNDKMGSWQSFRFKTFLFLCASITGIFFAVVWRKYEQTLRMTVTYSSIMTEPNNFEKLYDDWLLGKQLKRLPIDQEDLSYNPRDASFEMEDKFLYKEVPVLCVIFTSKIKRAKAIKDTWAKHCNWALFYGTYEDEVVPVSRIPDSSPWPLLCGGLIRSWYTYRKDFKWVMVTDDETYAIIENLRYLVAPLNASNGYYLGHPMQNPDSIFNLASAGFAINRKAMDMFIQRVPDDDECDRVSSLCVGKECVLGRVFQDLGIEPMDTRDRMGKGRFNPFNIEKLLIPGSISAFSTYWRNSIYLSSEGSNCCSDHAVTFRESTSHKMYMLEYTVYHLRPFIFGGKYGSQTAAPVVTTEASSDEGDGAIEASEEKDYGDAPVGQAVVKEILMFDTKKKQERKPENRIKVTVITKDKFKSAQTSTKKIEPKTSQKNTANIKSTSVSSTNNSVLKTLQLNTSANKITTSRWQEQSINTNRIINEHLETEISPHKTMTELNTQTKSQKVTTDLDDDSGEIDASTFNIIYSDPRLNIFDISDQINDLDNEI